ncbi:MAG: GGDEF domain-containing protein [Clostridia bacterium]|nr:GGDEF domain-containing protein [Clostridia bacterium]
MLSGQRKTIGAFLCKAYSLFDSAVYHALEEEAQRLNYNIIVFTTVGYFASQNDYDIQEKRMFSFAPIEELDGIIMAPDTYEIEGFREELCTAIRERAHCPVVAIRHTSDEFDCVYTDAQASFQPLMTHLIEEHGLRKIRFLAGYEGHPDSEKRLTVYREEMAAHGLPVDEQKDICHGNMWYDCGPAAYRHLFGDPEDRPEAVACANDYMAVGLMRALQEEGLRIPEDVIVTGFDNVPNISTNTPILTTVEQDFAGMAHTAMAELDRQIREWDARKQRKENRRIGISGKLVFGESCGCGRRGDHFLTELDQENVRTIDSLNNRVVGMTYLNIEMNGCDDLKQMHRVLIAKKSDTPTLPDLYVCLFESGRTESGEPVFAKEITDRVCLVHMMKDKQDCGMPMVSFDRAQLLPALAERTETQVLYLMGLHQNADAFGYAVFHYYPGNIPSTFFQHWNVILSSTLSNIHKRNEILALYEERRLSSITDVMTHLLNRRGLEEKLTPDWRSMCSRREHMAFIMFDMDHLKEINDTYGHHAGDYAIRTLANAIHTAAPKNAVIARMGGDEFLMVLPGADRKKAENYLRKFEKTLDEINRRENRSFRVEASYGFSLVALDEMSTLEQCIRMGDEAMYKAKEERHAQRQ